MATTPLSRVMLSVEPDKAALVLERLEREVSACGATYGFLINRAGQVVAADGTIDERTLTAIALRLVPVFLVSRRLARTFHEWPVRATVEDAGQGRLLTQPIDENWMLAMAFDDPATAAPSHDLSRRWLEALAPLARGAGTGRLSRRHAPTVVRDSVDLLFKDE